MRRLVAALLALIAIVVSLPAVAQPGQPLPPFGPAAVQRAWQQQLLGSPNNRPGLYDDAAHGDYPTMVFASQGRQYVAFGTGVNNAMWLPLSAGPLPADNFGQYISTAVPHAASAGTGYAQYDTVTMPGAAIGYVTSQTAGVLTPCTGAAGYQATTTLTLTTACVAGTIGVGATVTGSNWTQPQNGLPQGSYVLAILSGTPGAIGSTYQLNTSQTVGSSGSPLALGASAISFQPANGGSFTGSITGTTLTVSVAPTNGVPILKGALIQGTNVAIGTRITAQLTGTTYSVNYSQSAGSGTITQVSPATPIMRGQCPASLTPTAVAPTSTSGSGTGLTLDLALLQPVFGGIIHMSSCYTSTNGLLTVTNSITGNTVNAGWLANNVLDADTALSVAASALPLELYGTYADGPVPRVTTLRDQSLHGCDWTAPTLASAPLLYRARQVGPLPNAIPLTFPANNGAQSQAAAYLQMTTPSCFQSNAANMALSSLYGTVGGAFSPGTNSPISMANNGGSTFALEMANQRCKSTTGSASSFFSDIPAVPESPVVRTCVWTNGVGTWDSSLWPFPNLGTYKWVFAVNTTFSLTVAPIAGTPCPLPASTTVSYATTGSDTTLSGIGSFINAINNNTALQQAGIVARGDVAFNTAIDLFQPIGSQCALSSGAGASIITQYGATGAVGSLQGGYLGYSLTAGTSGGVWIAADISVPWTPSIQDIDNYKWSLEHMLQLDQHPGVIINAGWASNVGGFLTPWEDDQLLGMGLSMKRQDAILFNFGASGELLGSVVSAWATTQQFGAVNAYMTTGKPGNNVVINEFEYNTLTSSGTHTVEETALNNLYNLEVSKSGATGGNVTNLNGGNPGAQWTPLCVTEAGKQVTAIEGSEMAVLVSDLVAGAIPGCPASINLFALPVYNNVSGPYSFPNFVPFQNSHLTFPLMSGVQSLITDYYSSRLQ